MTRSRRAFTLIEILVVISIIGVLVALLLPAVQQAREGARRTECRNNMHQIGIALQSYHDAHRVFPPALIDTGARDEFHSWAAYLLPMMDEANLYATYNFNLPAAAGSNTTSTAAVLKAYNCASIGAGRTGNWGSGTYAGVAGKLSSYDPIGQKHERGILGLNSSVSIKRVRDGLSRTFICGETYTANDSYVVGWARGNYLARTTYYKINVGTGAAEQQYGFRSLHEGGAFFLFADSHVQFINESIDQEVFQALSTYVGGRNEKVVDDDDY